MSDPSLDLKNLPTFLTFIRGTENSGDLVDQLLGAGGVIEDFWGPLQMDVWELRVRRGNMVVRFGSERGFSDGVLYAPATVPVDWGDYRRLSVAVIAWARANGVPFRLDDPDHFDADLAANGLAALDWVGDGHLAEAERVHEAWLEYQHRRGQLTSRTRGGASEAQVRAVKAAGLAAIERAARPSV